MKTVRKVQIFEFTEITEFLKAIYALRKQQKDTFSYGVWARELGFKEPSFVRHLVSGRRSLSPETLVRLAESLELTDAERAYLEQLVKKSRLKSKASRDAIEQEIRVLRASTLARPEVRDHEEFVRNPLCPKIVILLSWRSQRLELGEISYFLNAPRSEVESALLTLSKLGLVKGESDARFQLLWRAETPSFTVSDKVKSDAIRGFHRASLADAQGCLELPTDERYFRSVFMVLDPEGYQALLEDLKAALAKAMAKFGQNPPDTQARLYQINLNVVPRSQKLTAKGTKADD